MKQVQNLRAFDSAAGRIDILFSRLAELAVRKIEAKTGLAIWDNFAAPIVAEKVAEYEGMGPVEFGRAIGFLKPERKRKKLKGAA
jgi:hypothetical protein